METVTILQQYVTALTAWSHLPKSVWIGSGVEASLLSVAVNQSGGKVVLHDHAAGAQMFHPRQKATHDYEFADTVVTYNENIAAVLKEGIDTDALVRDGTPDIVGFCGSGPTRPIRAPDDTVLSNELEPLNDGDRIMYTSLHYKLDANPFIPPVVLLDWQHRLLSKLQRIGYKPLFKPHPERRFAASIPFDSEPGIEVVDGAFEDVIGEVDAVIYDHIATSTFPFALWSDKPVILVDFDLPVMTDQNRSFLSERCAFVDGQITDKNRLTVDDAQLAQTIATAHESDGTNFLERYFTIAETRAPYFSRLPLRL